MANSEKKKVPKFNIVVMGDQYSGKTSIIERYTKGRYGPNYVCTVGSEFYRKDIEIKGMPITLYVLRRTESVASHQSLIFWSIRKPGFPDDVTHHLKEIHALCFSDTAGQEGMRTVIRSIYRRAQGVLLVFDVSRPKTLDHIKGWIDLIEMNCDIMPEMLLVGNKTDLSEREVTSKSAQIMAESKDMKYLEISAKLNQNIDEAFNTLSMQIYENKKRLYPKEVIESVKLNVGAPKKECCS